MAKKRPRKKSAPLPVHAVSIATVQWTPDTVTLVLTYPMPIGSSTLSLHLIAASVSPTGAQVLKFQKEQ